MLHRIGFPTGGRRNGRLIRRLAALTCLAIACPTEADGLTAKDIARMQGVGSARIAPDGSQVAYTLGVPRSLDEDSGSAWSELHVVDADGRRRPFITGEVNIGGIRWTPDGRAISFLAKRGDDEHKSLYLIPIDGGEARRVLSHETSIASYDWHPDGQQVAFLADEKKDEDKKDREEKGFNAVVYEEDATYTRAWVATIQDPAATRAEIPDDEDAAKPRMLELTGSASSLIWNPDGAHLLVALANSPGIDDHYMFRKLHVVNASSGTITATINNIGKLDTARWSRDGARLAFLSGEDIHDPSSGRLMIASRDGGEPRLVAGDYLPNFESLAWQNNDTVMFTSGDGCYSAFGRVNADGSDLNIIVPSGGPILSAMSLSRDGNRAAFIGHTPENGREVYLMGHGDSGPQRLTDSNPWLSEVEFARQEVIRYQASDGAMVEGVLIYPLDYQAGTRYPLIVYVHGGPEAHISNGWVTRYASPGQLAAAEGYAVFMPNYRGSTGRGVAFAKQHQSDYGGREFDDVIEGIDHLIDLGIVDRAKVGVTGGSYGGFATAWLSTRHTDRFAAGVMFVGISNQISKSGTTDIPEEMFLVHARKRIWDDWQFFLERSPIYYVQQARTPLLILHGKNDPRVHPGQSLELYRNLKILDQTPVRLVLYPGEGHGNRKSAARYDYCLRMMRWMDHYLKGAGGDAPPVEVEYDIEKATEDAVDTTTAAATG